MIWFILAGMAALAALAAVWPVLRGSPGPEKGDAAASESAFYRAQLAEIERDVARGQLPRSEAAVARALTRADDPDLCRRPGAWRHR